MKCSRERREERNGGGSFPASEKGRMGGCEVEREKTP